MAEALRAGLPASAEARRRTSGSWAYSALPGHEVVLGSRCPEMRWKRTCAPWRKRFWSPPPDSSTVMPSVGAPWSESFHAQSRASDRMAASEIGAALKVPSSAMPVDSRL